jgi:hypothetical protein
MAVTIAKHFADELNSWNQTIGFYSAEIIELTRMLGEVIERNSIPNIAARVELQQQKLNTVAGRFARLQLQFGRQETRLKTDNSFIDDSLVRTEMEDHQDLLRKDMAEAEKEYIDTRNDCQKFLSEIFKK